MALTGWLAAAGWAAILGTGAALVRMYRTESRADRILCLLYHRVVPRDLYDTFSGAEQIFSMPEDHFRSQLTWLGDNGYHFVSQDTLVDHLRSGRPLAPRAVFISFDDGCESVYKHALPILADLGIPSTVYVTIDETAWIFHEGEYFERRMSPDEVRACDAGGITIGSHAVSHRGLNEMGRDEVLEELIASRETLSEWIGKPVDHFAVPLNFYNAETLALCREAGYASVCTSDNGTANADCDPYKIPRFIVEGSYDLDAFRATLRPRTILQRRILNGLKKLPPKILGERIWMPLRESIFESALGRYLTFRHLRLALLGAGALGVLALVAVTAAALS